MKPIIKWVGGKSDLAEQIVSYFPETIYNYYEPFLGSMSIPIYLLNKNIKINNKMFLSDSNQHLIECYRWIQEDYKEFSICLNELIDYYHSYDYEKREKVYYEIRDDYNNEISEINLEQCCRFLFLNKTCFRGLYRVNSKGLFNVPYGNYKNCSFYSIDNFKDISEKIQTIDIQCCDYKDIFNKSLNIDDMIYLDPPYMKENSNSFVSYQKNEFNSYELFNYLHRDTQCNWIMSNSNCNIIKEHFKYHKIIEILARRAINSKKPDSKTIELLIIK
jgi:DNA adenine methylase